MVLKYKARRGHKDSNAGIELALYRAKLSLILDSIYVLIP